MRPFEALNTKPSPGTPGRILLTLTAVLFSAALFASASAVPPQAKRTGSASKSGVSAGLTLLPGNTVIDGSYGLQTLSVVANSADGSSLDVTPRASLRTSNPAVLRIENGIAYPVGDGACDVVASYNGQTARAKITVKNTKTDANINFPYDITPILLKDGCNGAACHGAPNGQGGLKLSFFGYDPDKDREAFMTADNGRRVVVKDAANSMAVLKPLGILPHAGGKRFAKGSAQYRTLVAWIRAGGPLYPKSTSNQTAGNAEDTGKAKTQLVSLTTTDKSKIENPRVAIGAPPPALETITVLPAERTITAANSVHQLIVTAHYADGSTKDVTPLARYFSDDEGIASAKSTGQITALRNGEANVMVRYNGKATVARFYSLTRPRLTTYPKVSENNFIDTNVFAKLRKMSIIPAPLCSDAEFLRRVSLDIAGVLPTADGVRNFVQDTDPAKRAKMIDQLLERPEYQDVMTIEWSELLRINRTFLQEAGVKEYTAYVRDSVADNKPFDQFVREIIGSGAYSQQDVERSRDAAEGAGQRAAQAVYREASPYHSGPVNYYRVTADPTELTTSTSQIFLGVRLDCCRCHNHPFDRWSMKDFYGFAAYFAGTGYTGGKVRDEVVIYTDKNGEIRNPRTNELALPKPLVAKEGEKDTVGDRHKRLAAWITSPDNPFFARATVNRFWKHFFGRGIVHPVDDFRATNPPINEPLMDALAKDFVTHGYDVKYLIRTICNSRTYQLSDKSNPTNETDTKNFSRYYSKRLGPEVLFDAIVTATGVPETFGMGAQARRATNLPDNNVGSYFLDVFGRSRRLQVQERSDATSMSQALHLMNGGTINDRITSANGTIAKILKKFDKPEEAIEEIYLSTLSRLPSSKEKEASLLYVLDSKTKKEGYEDLMWAILNSREFVFNH